jgi:hypothetical protein
MQMLKIMKVLGIKIPYDYNSAYANADDLITTDIPNKDTFDALLRSGKVVKYHSVETVHDYDRIAEISDETLSRITVDIVKDGIIVIQHVIKRDIDMLVISKTTT